MLAYSGKGHFVVEPVDLHELIGDTWELMAAAASKKVELHLDFTDDLMKVVGDISQIRQVFMNLIANAAEAIGERAGQVTITGKNTEIISEDMRSDDGSGPLAPGSYVQLQVLDTGAGILPDILPKIFDPFFSTKKEGHGLGLAAVLGIVRGHSGAINVKSEPGEGTVFELWLPATLAETQPKPQVVPAQETGHEVVLIVDDEAMVREVIREILTNSEMDVLEAKDGEEGLEIFEAHKDTITLLILDLTMPRLGGIDTLKRIRQIKPNIRVIFTSGYTKDDVARHFTTERSPHFLKKPFTSQELLQAIADSS
jgi:nitrogen fixation/metabolism regulation signal transduction histidine kinase